MTSDATSLHDLVETLESLHAEMRRRYTDAAGALERVLPSHRLSAANLIDYLTLRHFDMREIQESLAQLGLSSLGRAEEHVITTLERVINNLHVLAGDDRGRQTESAVSFQEGQRILAMNSLELLGPNRPGRPARILVTMPTEAATDYGLVADLMARGMDCARINCAHDTPEEWRAMAGNVRRAAATCGRRCRVLMDLPGPKLRTGPILSGPRVIRLRPTRDALGRVVAPARAVFVEGEQVRRATDLPEGAALIPVDREWLAELAPEDRVTLTDTRGAHRAATVTNVTDLGATVEFTDTTYVATGVLLVGPRDRETTVGLLPAFEQSIILHRGDVLTLTQDLSPVSPPAMRIGCTLPTRSR